MGHLLRLRWTSASCGDCAPGPEAGNIMLTPMELQLLSCWTSGWRRLRRGDMAAMTVPEGPSRPITEQGHSSGRCQYLSPRQVEGRDPGWSNRQSFHWSRCCMIWSRARGRLRQSRLMFPRPSLRRHLRPSQVLTSDAARADHAIRAAWQRTPVIDWQTAPSPRTS